MHQDFTDFLTIAGIVMHFDKVFLIAADDRIVPVTQLQMP